MEEHYLLLAHHAQLILLAHAVQEHRLRSSIILSESDSLTLTINQENGT